MNNNFTHLNIFKTVFKSSTSTKYDSKVIKYNDKTPYTLEASTSSIFMPKRISHLVQYNSIWLAFLFKFEVPICNGPSTSYLRLIFE